MSRKTFLHRPKKLTILDIPGMWRTWDGRMYEIAKLGDRHLLQIERALLGRAVQRPIDAERYNPADSQYRAKYAEIRAEISRRGLTLIPIGLGEEGAG